MLENIFCANFELYELLRYYLHLSPRYDWFSNSLEIYEKFAYAKMILLMRMIGIIVELNFFIIFMLRRFHDSI